MEPEKQTEEVVVPQEQTPVAPTEGEVATA